MPFYLRLSWIGKKGIVLVAQPEEITVCKTLMTSVGLSDTVCAYVPGGSDRQGSVHNGLAAFPAHCDKVLVHDAARALVTPEVIFSSGSMNSVERYGTGVAAIRVVDTIKLVDTQECVAETPDRGCLLCCSNAAGFHG